MAQLFFQNYTELLRSSSLHNLSDHTTVTLQCSDVVGTTV